ncbi:MAG: DedA family protein [Gammaproteobacteria bacterium]|jgi:membrane protein DedA with SNARE-associated domain
MSFEELVSTYGYAAVIVGTFLEGETTLVLGGFAAHRGYLELPWVIASAFVGTLFGDQLYYYLGRLKGKEMLLRRPRWEQGSKKVFSLLERHHIWLIMGFRFLYGLRTVTPFIIGTSNIPPFRFLVLNTIGAALWSLIIGVAGYLFGEALEVLLGNLRQYELAIFLALAAAGGCMWLYHFLKRAPGK